MNCKGGAALWYSQKINFIYLGFFCLHLKFSAMYTLLWQSWATFKNPWALPIFFYKHKGLYSFPDQHAPPSAPTQPFQIFWVRSTKKFTWRFSHVLIYTHSDVHIVFFSFPFFILRII
jgi:hypothetical protein